MKYKNRSSSEESQPKVKKTKTRAQAKKEKSNTTKSDKITDTKEEKKENLRKEIKKSYIKVCSPMLASDYKNYAEHINHPCYVQPKLDGVRAIYCNGALYSRNKNSFPELNHILDELNEVATDLILDGELYTDTIPFGELVGLVKKGKKTEEEKKKTLQIKYIIFDHAHKNDKFNKRIEEIHEFFLLNKLEHTIPLTTEICETKADVETFIEKYMTLGYEGLILRNKNAIYSQNRSKDLQKYKKFVDDEFEIIDYKAGTGKDSDAVIWVCKTKQGRSFCARPEGTNEERRKMYRNGKKYIGQLLTVRYQNLSPDGIPRFPVGVTIRSYE